MVWFEGEVRKGDSFGVSYDEREEPLVEDLWDDIEDGRRYG